MAERLTRNNKVNFCFHDEASNMVYYKLQDLEDILEKYGIDIQNLDYILNDYSKNQGRDFAICEERDDLKKDRDTWKRACELACEDLQFYDYGNEKTEDGIKIKVDYFYNQAKTEGMMSKEELIEEISDIRKQLYELQEENIDVDGYELGFVVKYLNDACEVLGELKEYLIRLLGGQ